MAEEKQRKGATGIVRLRAEKIQRVKRIVPLESGKRGEMLDAIDIYDEILEEGLTKRERKLGIHQ